MTPGRVRSKFETSHTGTDDCSIDAMYGLFNGAVSGQDPRPAEGYYAAGQLSYVAGLLAECPSTPIGDSAYDAVRAYGATDPDWSQARKLLAYGNFSEIMPMIHRGYFVVNGSASSGFDLDYSSAEFRGFEARDTLLSELGSGFFVAPPRNELENRLIGWRHLRLSSTISSRSTCDASSCVFIPSIPSRCRSLAMTGSAQLPALC